MKISVYEYSFLTQSYSSPSDGSTVFVSLGHMLRFMNINIFVKRISHLSEHTLTIHPELESMSVSSITYLDREQKQNPRLAEENSHREAII